MARSTGGQASLNLQTIGMLHRSAALVRSLSMAEDNTPLVRDRAYVLWELAGRPCGREHEFWYQASREIEGEPDRRHRTSAGKVAGGRRFDDPTL